MPYWIDRRLLIILTSAFIVATIIGTLTHECGHYFAARYLGYHARINYMSTSLNHTDPFTFMGFRENFLFLLGGPLETMLTGSIGLVLLIMHRSSFKTAVRLSAGQWTLVFITLFWLRQTVNYMVWLGNYFMDGKSSIRSDEIKLSRMLGMPDAAISLSTGIIGSVILGIVIFGFIPRLHRFTFILSGIIGGVSGYLLWLKSLGKFIVP